MLPGNQLFAKNQCKTFEEGTDLAVESLIKQIGKHKQKQVHGVETLNKAVLTSLADE